LICDRYLTLRIAKCVRCGFMHGDCEQMDVLSKV
jgi:hypothetical protein